MANPTFASRLIEKTSWLPEGAKTVGVSDWERYCKAVGAMFQPVATLAEEEGSDGAKGYVPPYGTVFNENTCPKYALKYLAQYVGVVLPEGGTEAEWRELVKAEAGQERGTPAAVESAIYRNTKLSKTSQTLRERSVLIERRAKTGTESAYEFGVSVPAAEVTTSEARLEAEVMAVTPAGLWPWFNFGSKYIWNEAVHKWSEDTFAWNLTNVKQP